MEHKKNPRNYEIKFIDGSIVFFKGNYISSLNGFTEYVLVKDKFFKINNNHTLYIKEELIEENNNGRS